MKGVKGQPGTVSDHICCGGSKGRAVSPEGRRCLSSLLTLRRLWDRVRGREEEVAMLELSQCGDLFCPAAHYSQGLFFIIGFIIGNQQPLLTKHLASHKNKLRSPRRDVHTAQSYRCFENLLLPLFFKTLRRAEAIWQPGNNAFT